MPVRHAGTMRADAAFPMRDVRDALRDYLHERPDAADTLVGIAQWWLPESMRGIALEDLRRALAELIAMHEVRCTILPDGTELYARAITPSRTTEAERHGH